MGGWIEMRMEKEMKKEGREKEGIVMIEKDKDLNEEIVEKEIKGKKKREIEEKGYLEEKQDYQKNN